VLFSFLLVSFTFLESLTFGGPWTTNVVMGLYLKSALAVGFFDPPSFFCCLLSICYLLRLLSIDPLRCTPISAAQKEQFLQTLDLSPRSMTALTSIYRLCKVVAAHIASRLSKTVLHTSALLFQLRLTTVVFRIPRAPNITLRLHPRTLLSGPDESFRFA
jgi:hypothetical protein